MNAPVVSVVIASLNGLECLERCLAGLGERATPEDVEVIVVERAGASLGEALARCVPRPSVVTAARPEMAAMRAQGLRLARGERVAVLADRFVPGPDWLRALARSAREGHDVVGGPVEAGTGMSRADWAAYLCEYAPFMPPFPAGPVRRLPDNNAAYSRVRLREVAERLEAGAWNGLLHEQLRLGGATLWAEPALGVAVGRRQGWGGVLRDRYHHSRAWSAQRLAEAAATTRLPYACATPAVPPVLLARLVRTLARKRRHGRRLLATLPGVLLLLSWGAAGEAVGALRGPGESMGRLR